MPKPMRPQFTRAHLLSGAPEYFPPREFRTRVPQPSYNLLKALESLPHDLTVRESNSLIRTARLMDQMYAKAHGKNLHEHETLVNRKLKELDKI